MNSARIQVPEIAERLEVSEKAVYALLEARVIPALRLRKRWIIGRCAYEEWEQHIGKGNNNGSIFRNTTALQ